MPIGCFTVPFLQTSAGIFEFRLSHNYTSYDFNVIPRTKSAFLCVRIVRMDVNVLEVSKSHKVTLYMVSR